MRRIIVSALGVCWMVSACQAPVATRAATKRASATPKAVASAPAPTPKASLLPTPAGPTVPLVGLVQIDAAYARRTAGATIISNNGGSVIAFKGGGIISNDGLGLISDNGLSLVADSGVGIISNNGGGYRVAATDDLAAGTILAAQGMAVVPVSLRSGKPLGQAVLSDATGHFRTVIPQSEQGNIRLFVSVPGQTKSDPVLADRRLWYDLVVSTALASSAVVDEDQALMSRFMRASLVGHFKTLMASTQADVDSGHGQFGDIIDPSSLPLVNGMLKELMQAFVDTGTASLTPDQQNRLAVRTADTLLSYVDLTSAMVDDSYVGYKAAGPEKALDALADVVKITREAAAGRLKEDPNFFKTQAYIMKAPHPVEIQRPSDLGDFVVDTYLTDTGNTHITEVAAVMVSLGVDKNQAYRMLAAQLGVMKTIMLTLFTNPDAKKATKAVVLGAKGTSR